MIRQLTKCNNLLQCLRVQSKLLVPASRALVFRMQSSKPPSSDNQTSTSGIGSKAPAKPPVDKRIYDDLVRSNKIVVFMKGTPKSPRCGFSNAVVQIFRMHGVEYDAHDVLANEELREGIKSYTDWPTIPQVFIDGEFIGGCDILLEMHQNGDLVDQLKKAGIESELLRLQREVETKNKKKKD